MFKKNHPKTKYKEIIESLNLDKTQKLNLKITWLDYLLLLDRRAFLNIRYHNVIQLSVVFLSLTIPIIQGSKFKTEPFSGISIISLISLSIAMMTALNNQLRYGVKWSHARRNAELVRNEGEDFLALAGNYQNFTNHSIALSSFITKINLFKRQEVNSYLETSKDKSNEKNRRSNGNSRVKN